MGSSSYVTRSLIKNKFRVTSTAANKEHIPHQTQWQPHVPCGKLILVGFACPHSFSIDCRCLWQMSSWLIWRRPEMRERMDCTQKKRGTAMESRTREVQTEGWKTSQRRWRWTTVKLRALRLLQSFAIANRWVVTYKSFTHVEISSKMSALFFPEWLLCVLQFSEIIDKISEYIGKQRKNSEGECCYYYLRLFSLSVSIHFSVLLCKHISFELHDDSGLP